MANLNLGSNNPVPENRLTKFKWQKNEPNSGMRSAVENNINSAGKDIHDVSKFTLDTISWIEPDDEKEDPLPKNRENSEICRKSLMLMSDDRWADAAQVLTYGLEANPNNAFLHASRALALLKLGEYRCSEQDCTKALAVKPGFVKVYLRRALARKSQGKLIDACLDLVKIMELQPEHKTKLSLVRSEYDMLVGRAAHDLAQLENASKITDATFKLSSWEKCLGNELLLEKQFDLAVDKYSNAIVLFPNDPTFYANRALCWMEKKNFAKAESDCSKALSIDENYLKVILRRAHARKELNDLERARDDLARAVQLSDDESIRNELDETEALINVLKRTGKGLDGK